MLSLTKSLPENIRLLSSWDLLPRFLNLLITEVLCLWHLNLTSLYLFSSFVGKHVSHLEQYFLQLTTNPCKCLAKGLAAGTGFCSIVSLLLYWEFVTTLRCCCIILVSKLELNLLHCYNSELTLSYFEKKSWNFSSRLLSFILMSLTKLELLSVSSWMTLFFTHFLILISSQNHIEICRYL